MSKIIQKIIQTITVIIVIYFIVFTMAKHIHLPTADLGRHITNGQLILHALSHKLDLKTSTPLFTNFYSYTEPSFAINNHHWLTGVLFAVIHDRYGFEALSILNILCVIVANILFFVTARFYTGTNQALMLVIFALPLTCWRVEVRPEQISFVMLGLLLLLLLAYHHKRIGLKAASLFGFTLMLLWVNFHIFFGFGLCIIAVFYFAKLINDPGSEFKERIFNPYFWIGLASCAGALCNPFGISGLLQPLTIFSNFAYDLAENQSVLFMHKRFPFAIIYYYYDLIALITIISTLIFLISKKFKLNSLDLSLLIVAGVLFLFGCKTTRSIPNYAFVSIPLFAYYLNQYKILSSKNNIQLVIINLVWISMLLCFYTSIFKRGLQLGLPKGAGQSAEFFRNNNIQGPICNNYDIGGYLIYYLFPYRKVFVDNRPEAYSASFFNDIYEPMQADETQWQKIDNKYNFNVIYFMRHDQTQHAQPFLIRRIQDPNWAPIFVDTSNIILLKRNETNRELIKRFELPQAMFKSVVNK